jgi:hypothetical protein
LVGAPPKQNQGGLPPVLSNDAVPEYGRPNEWSMQPDRTHSTGDATLVAARVNRRMRSDTIKERKSDMLCVVVATTTTEIRMW